MTNKKACGAILCASALIVAAMFVLGSGCGGAGGGDDLLTPPRESAFTPIYHPSNGGTFANPKDIGIGEFFGFLYEDDDQDGVTGQEDNIFWGGTLTWTDSDRMGEGRVVLRKHDTFDQYVFALYHTNPSPVPFETPAPHRLHSLSTIRVFEGYDPPEDRAPYVKSQLSEPADNVRTGYVQKETFTPSMVSQYGVEEEFEKSKRSGAVDNYLRKPRPSSPGAIWPDRDRIGELAGIPPYGKALAPPVSPSPTPDPMVRDVDTSTLTKGEEVYFSTIHPTYPFVRAEVLAVSPNSIIFGDFGEYPGLPSLEELDPDDLEDDIDWLQAQFDTLISPRMRLFFGDSDAATYTGTPPALVLDRPGVGDVDADGRVSILLTPLALDIGGGGFFYPGELIAYDETLFPITNEMNLIYVTIFDEPGGYPRELVAQIVCNEYLHLIHFIEKTYKRIVNLPPASPLVTIEKYINALQSPDINEMEGWVTEAFSSLAEDLAGYATKDFFSPVGRAWVYLDQTAYVSLTEDTHMLWVDGMGYLWFRYLMEQSGGMRYPTAWTDDLGTDPDDRYYIAERTGTSEHGIDFLRAVIGRKEVGLEVVEDAFSEFDTHGGRDFPQTFADFVAMLLLDNARDGWGNPLNTNAKYNLDRNAVWLGGIDGKTGFESGMRTHEDRLVLMGGTLYLIELDGPLLWQSPNDSIWEGVTDTGGGGAWALGDNSPSVWYVLFEPFTDYSFTGQYGTQYDSMEFFFASDTPWVQSYQRFKSGVRIFRVTDMEGFWDLEEDTTDW